MILLLFFFFSKSTHSATCFVFCKYLEKRSSKLRLKKNYREREKLGNLVCLHTWKRHMKAQSCVQLLHTNKIKFRNILPRTINLREERRQEAQHWQVLEQMRTTEQKHIEAHFFPCQEEVPPLTRNQLLAGEVSKPYELCTCEGATHSEWREVRQLLREVRVHGSVGPTCSQSPFSPQAPSPCIRDNKEVEFPLQIFIAIEERIEHPLKEEFYHTRGSAGLWTAATAGVRHSSVMNLSLPERGSLGSFPVTEFNGHKRLPQTGVWTAW